MTAVISDFLHDSSLDDSGPTTTSPGPVDRASIGLAASVASSTPPAAAVVPFTIVLAVTGMTRRQLDFWCRRGYVEAVPGRRGSGRPRVFTTGEYAVICHAYDLTEVGVAPEKAVALARKLLADQAPVVVEQDHVSVVVIRRARADVSLLRNRPAAGPDAVDVLASPAPTPTAAPLIASAQSTAAIAEAAAALVAAALCTCRHPRRVHEPERFCRLDACGCLEYERAVPGPPAFLPDPSSDRRRGPARPTDPPAAGRQCDQGE